jgi:hypothetical protein
LVIAVLRRDLSRVQSWFAGGFVVQSLAAYWFHLRYLIDLPFFIGGTLKIVYDLLLYRAFVSVRTPEETSRSGRAPPATPTPPIPATRNRRGLNRRG